VSWRAVAIALAVVGTLADAWTTRRGLAGGLREANPVSRWLIERTGRVWVATLAFDAVVVWVCAWFLDSIAPAAATAWLVAAGVGQLVVARLNHRLLEARRRRVAP